MIRTTAITIATLGTIATFSLGGCGADILTEPSPSRLSGAEQAAAVRSIAGWTAIALRTTAGAPANPPRETRALAIQSIAVFDAVNAIDGNYAPFVSRTSVAHDASVTAAVAAATVRVMKQLYPAAASALDVSYDSTMADLAAGAARDAGVAAGTASADAALAARASDHATDESTWSARSGAGMWSPTPPASVAAMEPGWGQVTPFFMSSGAEFRPAAPPALTDSTYKRDMAEILALGSATSTERSAFQAECGRFWIATAPQLWNQLIGPLALARALSPAETARDYMLLNVSAADAIIAAWDAKYAYQQWRPVTAIRAASAEPAPPAGATADWLPLIVTPPFPDYPAGHSTYAGAAEAVLTALFGTNPGQLSLRSPSAGGVAHQYTSFAAISAEAGDARVWAGVHWRTSTDTGRALGRRVGERVLQRAAQVR